MDGWMDGWMDGCMDGWIDGIYTLHNSFHLGENERSLLQHYNQRKQRE